MIIIKLFFLEIILPNLLNQQNKFDSSNIFSNECSNNSSILNLDKKNDIFDNFTTTKNDDIINLLNDSNDINLSFKNINKLEQDVFYDSNNLINDSKTKISKKFDPFDDFLASSFINIKINETGNIYFYFFI